MKYLSMLVLLMISMDSFSQQARPDTVFFNLYTDSLKPGTYNYINVVAKFGNKYLPLTSEVLLFKADTGIFKGNEWFIDESFGGDSVNISVTYHKYPQIKLSTVIYMKKGPSAIRVKTLEEVLRN